MPLWVKILISLVVGLVLGYFVLMAGVLVGGLGHGWVTPLWYSFAGPIIYPVVVFRLLNFDDRWLNIDIGLLTAGLLSDFIIYGQTIEEGVHFFYRVGEFAYVWICLWALWQVALPAKLLFLAYKRNVAGKSSKVD